MRIRNLAALAVAGAAMTGALAIGGVAYASGQTDGGEGETVVRIVDSGSTVQEDCPERGQEAPQSEAGL